MDIAFGIMQNHPLIDGNKRQDERSGICRLAESAVGQADLAREGEEWLACWICEV